MDIKFKSIHIENFMSIGEIDLDFVDKGFTLIEGVNNNSNDNARSNGSGKSSIFEALVWVLTGNTVRGNKDVVNYNREDGTLVTINMIVDNNTFTVTRTKEHSKYKTNLFIEINGVDKSGKGIRDSEKLLSEYLPDLTPSLIGSVIVLGQGLPQKFSNNSPSGRKEVLEKLFKSDYMIQDLKDRISKRRTELNDEIRKVQDNKLVNLTKIETLTDRINFDKVRLSQLEEMSNLEYEADLLHKDILQLEELVISTTDEMDCYNARLYACDIECYELKNKRLQVIADVDNEYADIISKVQDEINENSAQTKFTKSELDRVKNIKDICPTCGQKIEGIERPDITQYEQRFNELSTRSVELVNQMSIINNEISMKKASLTSKIDEEVVLKVAEVNSITTEIDRIKKELQLKNGELSEKRRKLDENLTLQNTRLIEMNSLRESIQSSESSIELLQTDIEKLNTTEIEFNERLAVQNKFNTVITRDFRGYLLNDIICYINEKSKEYCKLVFDTDLIDFCLDGNNLSIYYDNKEYEALSGGERQKVDLIIQFAIRDMLCKHTSFSSNIIVLDEIFDNLDDLGCQKILDLITTRLYDIDSVFIITHHGNELNIPYDTVIKIQKDNDGVTKVI